MKWKFLESGKSKIFYYEMSIFSIKNGNTYNVHTITYMYLKKVLKCTNEVHVPEKVLKCTNEVHVPEKST